MKNVFGIILKVSYPSMGDTSQIDILGKTMQEWVSISLGDAPYATVSYTDTIELPILVKPLLNKEFEYTAVLFSDTPLITKCTVADSVAELESSGSNVLKMTRGYVFKTEFLMGVEKLYTVNTHFFDEEDFVTAFNFRQVNMISDILRNRIVDTHTENGVRFLDANSAFIGADVRIGRGVTIGTNVILRGKTIIKDNVNIQQSCVIEDTIIESGANINSSQLYHSFVGERTTVGPYAYIRPDTVIGSDCRIGDFVEIKKSIIGNGSKVSHLSYVGDCEMGEGCNVGCGVVFVNYDGKNKFKSKVGNNVFIGSNSNIIAPVVLSDGSFIAAGSTLTDSVPEGALAIARARQIVKENWQGNKYKK